MASRQQIFVAARRILVKVHSPGFRPEHPDDLVELVAVLTYREHLTASTEGIAKLQGKTWAKLNRSQQGRYRSLARAAISGVPATQS